MAVDILALISAPFFEAEALRYGELLGVGDVWPVDRYISKQRAFEKLEDGGRIFLVTVRAGEALWLVGVLESPEPVLGEWIARAPNRAPIVDITPMIERVRFATNSTIATEYGKMAMSLQTPRTLTPESSAELAAVAASGVVPRAPSVIVDEGEMEPPPLTAPQLAAIENARAQAFVLADKMEETYGLRLPSELAWAAGWLMSLTVYERAEVDAHLGRFVGIGTWFLDEDARAPAGDERLRDRAADDPPELVPVFVCRDGTRLGYWCLDPAAEPLCVVVRAGGARATIGESLLLDALRERVEPLGTPYRRQLLDGIMATRARMLEEGVVRPGRHPAHYLDLLGASLSVLRADILPRTAAVRTEAYRAGSPDVERWAAEALADVEDRNALRALALGHELHHVHMPRWRLVTTELLVRAYAALGRRAHADTVRAMYLAEDADAPVFAPPPAHPLRAAVEPDDIGSALDEPGLTTSDVESALSAARSADAVDAIVDHPTFADHRAAVDGAVRRRLRAVPPTHVAPAKRALHHVPLVRLVSRAGIGVLAFEDVLRSTTARTDGLCTLAAVHVDIVGTHAGATALHVAARSGASDEVKILLDRGADPDARDAAGRTPADVAREVKNVPGTHETLVHLQRAAGGAQRPPPPKDDTADYAEGDRVHHRKLGDGVVVSVDGEGEEAKLLIAFATERRTFLAKFVTPR